MNLLTARDCLCPNLLRVQADQRHCNVSDKSERAYIFAVFDEDRFLGMVSEKQAALFPSRIFADLVVLRQPQPLPADTPLNDVLVHLHEDNGKLLSIVDADGNFLGAVTQTSLFAALFLSEQSLREEREALIGELSIELGNSRISTNVFEATSEGILVTAADNTILLVNRAFTETTGYTLEEVRGKKPGMLSSGRHDATFYANMWNELRALGRWSGEVWNRRKNGEIYPEWLHINIIRDPDGQPVNYIGLFSDITYHKDMQHQLHRLAYYDALTDLPNRSLFYDRLDQAIMQARRDNGKLSLLFIDLDRFKDVNDSLGHAFGDRLLILAGLRLRELVRESDTVARLGGDEFTVILSDGTEEWDAAAVAAKIIEAFTRPIDVDDHTFVLSTSIGVGRYPDDGETADALLRSADTAMYQAKAEGGSHFCFFTPELNRRISERLNLENALRSSLKRDGDLYLAWQPQVRLADGTIIGMEALARWHHPELGEVPPSRFIPIAEQVGLISDLGAWVMDRAAKEAAQMLNQVGKSSALRFSVNISARQICTNDLASDILATLVRHDLSPGNIEIEITESTVMDHENAVMSLLGELMAQGVQFAVDDFGTGYSNLASLKRFSMHRIKIDQSFVRELAQDTVNQQIIVAIIGMAYGLGLRVIAEGVETPEQRDMLVKFGCKEGQGYLFGRPQPLESLMKLLSNQPTLSS